MQKAEKRSLVLGKNKHKVNKNSKYLVEEELQIPLVYLV